MTLLEQTGATTTSDTYQYLKLDAGRPSDISNSRPPQNGDSASDITDHDPPEAPASSPPRRGARPKPLPERYAAAYDRYEALLRRPGFPLDPHTVRAYLSRVRQYLAWLDESAVDGNPLEDASARDWAARDYRSHLLAVAKRAPTTVNAHLTAIDDFGRRVGVGAGDAKRVGLPNLAPRALDHRAQVRFLREAERAPLRDRAIALTGFYAGPRIHELAALDVDDVHLSARKGVLIIRQGKNNKYREMPIHSALHPTLEQWMPTAATERTALFPNQRGARLSTRGIYDVLTGLADLAGIEDFTPHVLRHTLGTTMRQQGVDVVVIAELLGHSVEVARRYALPTEDERRAAIEKHTTDG